MDKTEVVALMEQGGKATRYEAVGVAEARSVGRRYYVLETPDRAVAVDPMTYSWLPVWAAEAGIEFDDTEAMS